MIGRTIAHMHWANAAAIAWMKENPDAPEECRRLLSHVLNAEKLWIARARREAYDRDVFRIHPPEAMSVLNDANHAGFLSLLEMDLKEPVDYHLLEGTPGRSNREDIILHAFSHGFHHFGQMAALASRAGRKFPNVSYLGSTRSR